MSTNVSLKNHLNNLLAFQYKPGTKQIFENSINLQALENELKDVTIAVTFWGTRSVTKPGYSGSVNLRWLAYKVNEISVKYPPAAISNELVDLEQHEVTRERVKPLCTTPERVAGRAVQQRVRQLFAESDEMLKNSFFARIFRTIREFFVYNTTRPSILGVNFFGDPLSVREAYHMTPTPTFTRGLSENNGNFRSWRF